MKKCLSIKGAEDAINKPHAFEISTTDYNMFFIADSDKVGSAAAYAAERASRVASCCPHSSRVMVPCSRWCTGGSNHHSIMCLSVTSARLREQYEAAAVVGGHLWLQWSQPASHHRLQSSLRQQQTLDGAV